MKKFSMLSILIGISLAIGVGVSIAACMVQGGLFVGGVFQVWTALAWFLWGFIVAMLLCNVFFSNQFMSGKGQEILFLLSCSLLISDLLAYIVYAFLECGFVFSKLDWLGYITKIITQGDWRYYSILVIVWIIFILIYVAFVDRNIINFGNGYIDKDLKQVEGNLENSRWMTKEEIEKQFKPTLYSKLGDCKKDGIPVMAELTKKGKDLKVAFSSPCHSIIIGSTGSGKTTTFVSPMIQLIGATAAGSSMVVTDPKGELFSLHSKFLQSRGYDVRVVDLRDTYSSYRWNPLDSIWDNYQSYLNANKNVFLRTDDVHDSGLKFGEDEKEFEGLESYYEFEGKAYAHKDRLIESIKVYKKKTYDECYEDLNDLCSVLIPIENDKDPMWEKGARSIVFAVLLAMLEDSEDERLGMTKEKFCFFNMTKILQNSSDDYKELRDYFKGRKKLSKALSLSKQVCDAATQTRASYMSIVYDKLTMFNDAGICALTSASDFTAGGLAERPTALFLKIPDEKDTRHNLAAIFILNIYKTLIKIASATEELTLPRNVYFIMDEFGNMPKIEKFDKFITVGRSRKIWFNMIVQSYAQLNNVYGETVADIVKGNCGIKMFIGSNDSGTCKEYSELCGNITVVTRSKSGSLGKSDENFSDSTQVRPLIYPSELQRLNHPGDIGHSIIVTFGNFPLKTYFSPSFKVPFYKMGKMDTSDTDRYFDENSIAYSVPNRNKILKDAQTHEVELRMATQAEHDKKANEEKAAKEAALQEEVRKAEEERLAKEAEAQAKAQEEAERQRALEEERHKEEMRKAEEERKAREIARIQEETEVRIRTEYRVRAEMEQDSKASTATSILSSLEDFMNKNPDATISDYYKYVSGGTENPDNKESKEA